MLLQLSNLCSAFDLTRACWPMRLMVQGYRRFDVHACMYSAPLKEVGCQGTPHYGFSGVSEPSGAECVANIPRFSMGCQLKGETFNLILPSVPKQLEISRPTQLPAFAIASWACFKRSFLLPSAAMKLFPVVIANDALSFKHSFGASTSLEVWIKFLSSQN